MIVIDLPGLPRGKGRPRFSTRNGFARAHTDPQTASYEGALRLAASVAMVGLLEPLAGPAVDVGRGNVPGAGVVVEEEAGSGAIRIGVANRKARL